MSARIPVRFERVAAAFDARVRPCESSGSEHSAAAPESSSADLSDMVKSFMEKSEMHGGGEEEEEARECDDEGEESGEFSEREKCGEFVSGCCNEKYRERLLRLFGGNEDEEDDYRNAKEKIAKEVEIAYRFVGGGDKSSPEFKRRLMTRLREKGFDAGLCKSKWEKTGRFPGGTYEYIDINLAGNRYIVEVSLAGEFGIARPTSDYSSLMDVFPAIFVGKAEEVKKIVKVMCSAMKASLKCRDLHVAPWRRQGYMQAKWLSSYRRTTNEVSSNNKKVDVAYCDERLSINGFQMRLPMKTNCREEFSNGTKKSASGFRVGLLASALN